MLIVRLSWAFGRELSAGNKTQQDEPWLRMMATAGQIR